MAQSGNFTPILLYSSSTATNVPSAANLTNSTNGSEIAINIADKNLFFKDSTNAVNTVPIRQSSTSSNGWLSSIDWNTFNGKAPATSGTSILYGNGSGGFNNVTIGSGITFAGGTLSATGSGGTVTSVTGTSPVVSSGGTTPAISLATAYGDTLNPYASKTANYILAAPNGSAGVPTFRALVAADLPSLSGTYIPYTGASSAIDLNAKTVVNIANLGINTTSVPTILIRAIGDNNSGSRIAMRGYSSNTSSSAIRVTKFRGTFASPQAPLSGDSLGKFELAGYGTTSSDGYPQASYEGVATENWGATARGTKTLFKVTPNTTITQVTAFTINQDSTATFANSVTATLFSGSGASLTSIPNSALVNSAITINGTNTSLGGSISVGTVTSVTGTAPVVSSGGATPAISMAAANTTTNGYLTSTDWNTFNGKSNTNGTVTSVAALTLGTTGTDLSSTVATDTTTPVITLQVPTASATNRGALSSTDWSTFNGKQAALVSGTNIKTVGGVSLLGSGDVGIIGATYGGTGVNNSTNTITIAGNLTHAGAFTQTFTATGNTSLTLPTSGYLISTVTNMAANPITGTPSILTFLRGDGTWATPAGAGTVTSVAATVPSFLSVTGSPITSSGTLAISYSGTALPVLNGGTGTTTSTGTGSVVLGTRPTISVTGSGFTLQDATDNTKQANFVLSGLTTGTNYTYALPATTGSTIALLSGVQTFTGTTTFSSTFSVTNGQIILGNNTGSQQVDLGVGVTTSGRTKTINIGTGGLAGSTTNIGIGSTAGTSTTTINGTLALGTALPVASGGTGLTSTPANGALDIGNGTGFTRTTLTAGTGISITNASGAITITNTNLASGTATASTSGTSISYTSIPSTVKRITIMFNGVSLNGSANFLIQIGAGSTTSSGYNSTTMSIGSGVSSAGTTSTSGFIFWTNNAGNLTSGQIILTNITGNTWVCSGNLKISSYVSWGAGDVALSGTLDRVIITTSNGTDTFDAGSVNILYE